MFYGGFRMKKNFSEFKEFIKNKKVAVVGIGVSNIPLIKFLVKLGADVSAFDIKDEKTLGNIADDFKEQDLMWYLKHHQ